MKDNTKTLKEYVKFFIEALENPMVAFFLSVFLLIFIGKFNPKWWGYIIMLSLTFLFADILSHFILRGGKGIAQILPGLLGNRTRHQGHVYLVFFISILTVPILSDGIANYLATTVMTTEDIRVLIISSITISSLIFIDLKSTFYERKK